ncbi:MAG: AbrB/MazE/SpoVT family DNA-binding domain-containing protein [Zestosphaera sp.]
MALTALIFILKIFILRLEFYSGGAVGFMPTMARTRVGRYYRTTIPREVRKLLELRENDEVEWVFENGEVGEGGE